MVLEVNTPTLSTPLYHTGDSTATHARHQARSGSGQEPADVIDDYNRQKKVKNFDPADFLIDKEEIKSILFLGIPTLTDSSEQTSEEPHTIDTFA